MIDADKVGMSLIMGPLHTRQDRHTWNMGERIRTAHLIVIGDRQKIQTIARGFYRKLLKRVDAIRAQCVGV